MIVIIIIKIFTETLPAINAEEIPPTLPLCQNRPVNLSDAALLRQESYPEVV
jgi:hypothetical protein